MDKLSLDTDVAKILARLNRSNSDTLLHSIAEELLRLHQAYLTIVARMYALEKTQAVHDHIVSSGDAMAFGPLPRTADIDASFSLPAESGFYPLEYDKRGVSFRWTGPEPTFFFELFIDRKAPANIRMHYSKGRLKEAARSVRCYVDGAEIATTQIEVDGAFELHGVLPSRDLAGGTVISFTCPSVSSPAEDGQSPDTRLLGLIFRRLRIDPRPDVSSGQVKTPSLAVAQSSSGKLRQGTKSAGEPSA